MPSPIITFRLRRAERRGTTLPHVILSLAAAVAIVIAAGAGAFYFIAVKGPADLAHRAKEESFDAANRVAEGFKSVFNFTPQVTVNGVTVIEQATAVIELATVKQDVMVRYHWSQMWLGSTKEMELEGVYKAKAGFDLHEPFQINVDKNQVGANLPAPKLLSLEMTSCKILKDDSGWWNAITSQDRANAIAAMQAQAREKAVQSGLLTEAKAKFRQELSGAIEGQNISTPVTITFQDETPVKINPESR